ELLVRRLEVRRVLQREPERDGDEVVGEVRAERTACRRVGDEVLRVRHRPHLHALLDEAGARGLLRVEGCRRAAAGRKHEHECSEGGDTLHGASVYGPPRLDGPDYRWRPCLTPMPASSATPS